MYAEADGISVNQFIATAVAEKLAYSRTAPAPHGHRIKSTINNWLQLAFLAWCGVVRYGLRKMLAALHA
jgi:hypothetical protein